MDKQRLIDLLEKHISETLTASESEELSVLFTGPEAEVPVREAMETILAKTSGYNPYEALRMDPILQKVLGSDKLMPGWDKLKEPLPMSRLIPMWRRITAAAAILILLAGGGYWWETKRQVPHRADAALARQPDISPGGQHAVLTLANGSTIILDQAATGELAQQGNSKVVNQGGTIAYHASGNNEAVVYNTMSTPRGGQFQLVLPDGTKVWLNAASSLRYPTSFTGYERKVEISGEAYFEVAKNVERPFLVKINEETEVEVLGTHFNVNAYKDEPAITTTLLEGAVKVISKKKVQLLDPGQQVQVKGTELKLIKAADVAQAVAWKNGSFSFVNADLPAVMRQVARWYNVEVEYKGAIPAGEFNGKIGNSLTLDQLLKGLAKTRINYRIENNNKILILP